MGLPFWRPPEGTSYLATYGASRASAQAAAELLGLAPLLNPRFRENADPPVPSSIPTALVPKELLRLETTSTAMRHS